jgi:signal transduction histidine kinase
LRGIENAPDAYSRDRCGPGCPTNVLEVSGPEEAPARILVVEGDPETRAALDLLLGARWAVTAVEQGDAAWELARGARFDLVIADVDAPGLDAVELVRRLRSDRQTQDVAVILIAPASARQSATLAGLEAGADDLLVKPLPGRELLARVNTRLGLTTMRRRNAQQEEALAGLRRTLRARDEFLSAASHELRTPITTLSLQTDGLLGVGQTVRPGVELDDKLRRRLTAVRRQVDRLTELVDQLLDVSRLIEGRLTLNPEPVDLGALVSESVELLRDSASRVGSTITVQCPRGVVGHWDRLRLGQIVTNLLSNAIKFGRGRPIEVALAADGANARLEVKDDGEGIPLHEQERIFDRFERATSVRQHPGLGLGLWICKQIVEASHGTISVRSQPGNGATFIVELPRGV